MTKSFTNKKLGLGKSDVLFVLGNSRFGIRASKEFDPDIDGQNVSTGKLTFGLFAINSTNSSYVGALPSIPTYINIGFLSEGKDNTDIKKPITVKLIKDMAVTLFKSEWWRNHPSVAKNYPDAKTLLKDMAKKHEKVWDVLYRESKYEDSYITSDGKKEFDTSECSYILNDNIIIDEPEERIP